MKPNPAPSTFLFSQEIQNEYQILMNSRESFSRNLTPVEQRKLRTLYDQLEEAWLLNRTDALYEDLKSKLNGLNQIQKQINQDWTNWKETVKEKHIQRLNLRKSKLNRDLLTLNNNRLRLKSTIQDWKTDILEREKGLSNRQEYSRELSENRLTREQVEQLWERSMKPVKKAYREIQKEYETISETSLKTKKRLEDGLKFLKLKNLNGMNGIKSLNQQILNSENEKLKKLQLNLSQKLATLEKSKQKKIEELNQNLKSLEMQLLKQLAKEIYQETPNCPKELGQYLRYGDFSAITMIEQGLTRDTNRILSLLEAELGKHGKSLQWFFNKYEPDTKSD